MIKKYHHSEETKEKIRQGHLKRGLSFIRACDVCNKKFRVSNCRRKSNRFCSSKCRAKIIMPYNPLPKGNIPWNKGLSKNTDIRIFRISQSRLGRQNWMWNGGVTKKFKDKHKREWNRWRDKVFQRDNWTCRNCNKSGGRLHPHHIKKVELYPELAFDIDNGLTLCIDCHKLTKNYGRRYL